MELLDRIVATPLELLCDERWQRTLDGHANVVWLAILTVAEQDDPLRIGRKRRCGRVGGLAQCAAGAAAIGGGPTRRSRLVG